MTFRSAPIHLKAMAMAIVMVLGLSILIIPAGAQAALTPLEERVLAERFAPVYYFHGDERLFPVDIENYVTLCDLKMTTGGSPVLVEGSITSSDLTYYDTNYYLDNRLGTIDDDGIVTHYQDNLDALGYSVYSRVTYFGELTIVQYWTFYYFNEGNLNRHEGDWEMTQVILDAGLEPVRTTYSQHESGMTAVWSDVEKDGEHYKVYVARGSHANYYRSYSGGLGLADDEVGADKKLTSDDYDIIMLSGSEPWLNFMGRWGSNEGGDALLGQAGPQGPYYRQYGSMWHGASWANAGETLNSDKLLLEWLFYNFLWIFIGIVAIFVALSLFLILRRRKAGKVIAPYLGLLDFKGNKMRAAGNAMAIIALVLGVIAVFLPYYTISLSIDSPSFTTEGFRDIVLIDGVQGLRINTLDPEAGLVQLTALPIPLSVILLTPLIFLVLGTIGVSDSKIARKFLTRGITMLLPVIIILTLIASISSLFVLFPEGVNGVDDAKEVLNTVAGSPITGSDTVYLSEIGESADVRWGLGLGSYLLIVTSILFFIAVALRYKGRGQSYPGEASVTTPQGEV